VSRLRRPNVVWLLVDSIRTYPTDADNRGKLRFMEEFGAESVEFAHCVTTAPSTIMSVTAMMTGLPAYFIARNYDDFRFDNRHYESLPNVLKRHGYASLAFLRGQETRLKFRNLMDPVPESLWPDHLRHGLKWSNEDLLLLLRRVLDAGVPRPAFLFFHFNPATRNEKREMLVDDAVDENVRTAHRMLREAGFTPDDTITVVCSDHGFPDPSKGMTSEWEEKHRLTHDLVLTDDNILIPMYLQVPGIRPRRIDRPIGSMDIFPTILEMAGVPGLPEIRDSIVGESLAPVLRGEAEGPARRFFRCDARLMLQTGRATALRGADYKYIRFHDDFRVESGARASTDGEVLLDLRADPGEVTNLLDGGLSEEAGAALAEARDEFQRTEARAVEFQVRYLLARQPRIFERLSRRAASARVLLAFEPGTAGFSEIGVAAVSRALPDAGIELLGETGTEAGGEGHASGSDRTGFDLALVFVQDSGSEVAARLRSEAGERRAREVLVVDCNFNSSARRDRYWYYRFRAFGERMRLVSREPSLVLDTLRRGAFVLWRQALRRLGRWDRWDLED
jgi:hypothetical protein